MSPPRGVLAGVLCAIVTVTAGCAVAGDSTAQGPGDKWSSTATEVSQPAEWPARDYVEGLARSRDLVRRYLAAAAVGDRGGMTELYLESTRRSAVTVIARDLELAGPGGPYRAGADNMTSVFVFKDRLFPPSGDFRVEAEDETRLRELTRVHDDASIVMARFSARREWRAFFVVRDGDVLHLVP